MKEVLQDIILPYLTLSSFLHIPLFFPWIYDFPLSPFVFFFFVELAPLLQLNLGKRNKKIKCKCYYVLCWFICLHYFTWCVKPYLCMCFFLIYTYIYPILCRMKQPYTILHLHIHVQSHTFIFEMYIYYWYHIYSQCLVMWCQNICLFEKKGWKINIKIVPFVLYLPLYPTNWDSANLIKD